MWPASVLLVRDAVTSDAEQLGTGCVVLDGERLQEVGCNRDHDARVAAVVGLDDTARPRPTTR